VHHICGRNCYLFSNWPCHLGTYLLVGLTHPCRRNFQALFAVTVLMVIVLNFGVCSRFMTKDFVDANVLICGSNFYVVVVFLKSFAHVDC
jgi:hypothetical protein